MKLLQVFNEMLEVAKNIGIVIRKENGSFRSGFCIINEKEMIVLNRATTLETMTSVLAKSLSSYPIDNIYIKPVVRDYIDKERELTNSNIDNYELNVN